MQAIVMESHGPPDVLTARSYRDPVVRPGFALVALRAAAVNRRDTLIRAGAGPAYRFGLPLIPGSDGAGTRCDTGEEVMILPSLSWGPSEDVAGPDFRILGGPDDGTYAELVTVPEINALPKPTELSWAEAAALPLATLTAYRALFRVAGLKQGQWIAILGAGGGVSLAAIQLAAHAGARIAVTSSSRAKLERAVDLGAEVAISYLDPGWSTELLTVTGGVEVVLDSVGTTWQRSLDLLRPGGALVACGGTGGGDTAVDVRSVYLQQKRILGTKMGTLEDFRALLAMSREAALRPIVDSVRPFAEASTAHRRLESGEHFGKLVLSVG